MGGKAGIPGPVQWARVCCWFVVGTPVGFDLPLSNEWKQVLQQFNFSRKVFAAGARDFVQYLNEFTTAVGQHAELFLAKV